MGLRIIYTIIFKKSSEHTKNRLPKIDIMNVQ